jgi:Arc/MetJ-type ribon-helix-helix transcriptional regulator
MTDLTKKDDDAAFAANLKKYRQRSTAEVNAIKAALTKWLESREHPGDYVSVTTALLDLALDRHVAVHEADGFDLIEAAYRRALQRSRGPLQ